MARNDGDAEADRVTRLARPPSTFVKGVRSPAASQIVPSVVMCRPCSSGARISGGPGPRERALR